MCRETIGCVEGTLVLTDVGQVPIENIEVGTRVLTCTGEWGEVTEVQKSEEDLTVIVGGGTYGLECAIGQKVFVAKSAGKEIKEREWRPAGELQDERIATPRCADPLCSGVIAAQKDFPKTDEKFWYFVGRFIADGWTEGPRVVLCSGEKKLEKTEQTLRDIGVRFKVRSMGGETKRHSFHNAVLTKWLDENFGKYAYGKSLPSWVYGLTENYRIALLQGVIDCDGYTRDHTSIINTVSEKLALGLRFLGETLGRHTSITSAQRKPAWCCKKVSTFRRVYVVRISDSSVNTEIKDGPLGWYGNRRTEEKFGTKTVYSLTVRDANSYVANGMVVGT